MTGARAVIDPDRHLSPLDIKELQAFLSLLCYEDVQLDLQVQSAKHATTVYYSVLRSAIATLVAKCTTSKVDPTITADNAEDVARQAPHALKIVATAARYHWSGTPTASFVPSDDVINKCVNQRLFEVKNRVQSHGAQA